MDLRKVGQEYEKPELVQKSLKPRPDEQLKEWMELALASNLPYANAAILATVSTSGYPQARIVLIKEIKDNRLVFFTNYNSAKAKDIAANAKVSVNIYWKELDRQARILGVAEKTSERESREYFYSRSRQSQISAVASDQSAVTTKEELYAKVKELEEKWKGQPIPYPNYWGGYQIKIEQAEFWQGRPSRLHDRFRYLPSDKGWVIERLAP